MKKTISIALALIMVLSMLLTSCVDKVEVTVDGSDMLGAMSDMLNNVESNVNAQTGDINATTKETDKESANDSASTDNATDDSKATYYIYVREDGRLAVGTHWITATNDLVEAGKFVFGMDGKCYPVADDAVIPNLPSSTVKDGVVLDEDGVWRYYVNGVMQCGNGVVKLTDEDGATYYVYVRNNGHLVTGNYWAIITNGLLKKGAYDWGTDGRYYPAD